MSLDEPPKKRKRLSKNKKKNWSKTDITDVEEHLETTRLQLRTGGLAEEKEDEELFFVDKRDKEPVKENETKKKRKVAKPLKCHSLLQMDTKVKPVIVAHNVPLNNIKKKSKHVIGRTGPKTKDLKAVADCNMTQRNTRQRQAVREKMLTAQTDLWGEDAPQSEVDALVQKPRVKVPFSIKRKVPSELPAVEVAHPGQSYNPTLDDHQDLIKMAVAVEAKKEKALNKIKRAVDDTFPSAKDAPTEASYIQEMSAGLFDMPNAEEEEDNGAVANNPPVRRENKKTERQRKKEEARKLKALNRQKEKEDRLKRQEMFRLKSLKADIRAREANLTKKAQLKALQMEADRNKTKKLGKLKYEDPSLPLKLSHELEGSLRLLKPEGFLLEDRFKSLQKRNIIEPRDRAKTTRKYKHKTFEKKSHKAVILA